MGPWVGGVKRVAGGGVQHPFYVMRKCVACGRSINFFQYLQLLQASLIRITGNGKAEAQLESGDSQYHPTAEKLLKKSRHRRTGSHGSGNFAYLQGASPRISPLRERKVRETIRIALFSRSKNKLFRDQISLNLFTNRSRPFWQIMANFTSKIFAHNFWIEIHKSTTVTI